MKIKHCFYIFSCILTKKRRFRNVNSLADCMMMDGEDLGDKFLCCIVNYCQPIEWSRGVNLTDVSDLLRNSARDGRVGLTIGCHPHFADHMGTVRKIDLKSVSWVSVAPCCCSGRVWVGLLVLVLLQFPRTFKSECLPGKWNLHSSTIWVLYFTSEMLMLRLSLYSSILVFLRIIHYTDIASVDVWVMQMLGLLNLRNAS